MKELTFKVITLNWQKLNVNIQHNYSSSSGGDKLEMPETEIKENKAGLYQIYGDSIIYGLDSLLYIGSAMNLKKHLEERLFKNEMINNQQNLSIRYALVDKDEDTEVKDMLDITKSINIAMHKPSMNSQNIAKPYKKDLYLVENHGERGVLNIQVSNSYWV
jgi:hypothetical protein